jgi:hypothetical protein
MNWARIFALCALGLPAIWTSDGQAAIPLLTSAEMNCANLKATQDAGLTEAQANDILKRLQPLFLQKTKKAGRTAKWEIYTGAFCSVTRDGQKYIVLDGIYKFMGVLICDDAAGFGIVYDPRNQTFGDLSFGVNSCSPGRGAKSP